MSLDPASVDALAAALDEDPPEPAPMVVGVQEVEGTVTLTTQEQAVLIAGLGLLVLLQSAQLVAGWARN